ncbi:Hypothetical_protein [Hexamita inflata]|uniref:Hypothetical_protein n=1 Tax=Hexamita inflata TaxID=28002 RepID=A0AA86QEK5_9EUKA|nr:Hypothetical protein HINF_LOCUS39234 [Hexamita inflata]
MSPNGRLRLIKQQLIKSNSSSGLISELSALPNLDNHQFLTKKVQAIPVMNTPRRKNIIRNHSVLVESNISYQESSSHEDSEVDVFLTEMTQSKSEKPVFKCTQVNHRKSHSQFCDQLIDRSESNNTHLLTTRDKVARCPTILTKKSYEEQRKYTARKIAAKAVFKIRQQTGMGLALKVASFSKLVNNNFQRLANEWEAINKVSIKK